MDYFQVGAIFEKASTLKDGSLRITFDTQEVDAEKMAKAFELRKTLGHLIFAKPNSTIEIPEEKPRGIPDPPNMKSRSQRLRAILYRVWEQRGKPGTSESFYNMVMDEIIDQYLAELE